MLGVNNHESVKNQMLLLIIIVNKIFKWKYTQNDDSETLN